MTLDPTPAVSICIPTYLGAQHINTTIDSVLNQSFTDFELIIIDDNSHDETIDIISSYKDQRIRYYRNANNLGPEGNWNRCLQEARGKYFKLLPQDDLLYPDTLRQQVEILEKDTEESISLVFGSRNIIGANDNIISRRGYPGRAKGYIFGRSLIRNCVRFGTNLIGEPGGVLMRKSLTAKIGAFDADVPYVIDLDYWVRSLEFGDGYYIPEQISAFRVYPGSWSVAIGTKQGKEYCKFINKLAKNSSHKIGTLDCLIGKFSAHLNNIMRLIFYMFFLKKNI